MVVHNADPDPGSALFGLQADPDPDAIPDSGGNRLPESRNKMSYKVNLEI